MQKFGNEYGDGDFGVYFRKNGVLHSCAPEDTPENFEEQKKTVKEIVGKFKWDDTRLVELLAFFIETRRSYWPAELSMEDDLTSVLQNVANEEDSWGKFKAGEEVHVNRDDPQWGRIAEYGTVTEMKKDGVLVLVGGVIRANVLCKFDEVSLRYEEVDDDD